MPLQDIDFFGNLPFSPLDPTGTDSRTISDDQHRNVIASLNRQAPNWTGTITATHEDINTLVGNAANGTKPMPGVALQTVLYFYNVNTPPPGWSLLTPDANIRQLVIGDAAQGGTIGGTTNPVDETHPLSVLLNGANVLITGSTEAIALSLAQMPAHNHGAAGLHKHFLHRTISGAGGLAEINGQLNQGDTVDTTFQNGMLENGEHTHATEGNNEAHAHGAGSLGGTIADLQSTGTLQITPRYASGILGTLNA